MLGEDVEDQRSSIDNLDLDHFFQSSQLSRGQLAIADDGVGAGGQDDLTQLVSFAGPDIGCRIRLFTTLDETFENFRPCRLGEGLELGETGIGLRSGAALRPDPDQDNPFES